MATGNPVRIRDCPAAVRREEPDLFDEQMTAQVSDMLAEAADCETQFAEDLLGQGVAGLPLDAMRQYLEHVADRRLARLGVPPRYGSANPLGFMDLQDVQELSNFFERRVSAYQVAVSGTVAFDEDFLSSGRTVVLVPVLVTSDPSVSEAGKSSVELLLLFAVLFGGYLFSLRAHPLRGCPACKMTGRRGAGLLPWRRCASTRRGGRAGFGAAQGTVAGWGRGCYTWLAS